MLKASGPTTEPVGWSTALGSGLSGFARGYLGANNQNLDAQNQLLNMVAQSRSSGYDQNMRKLQFAQWAQQNKVNLLDPKSFIEQATLAGYADLALPYLTSQYYAERAPTGFVRTEERGVVSPMRTTEGNTLQEYNNIMEAAGAGAQKRAQEQERVIEQEVPGVGTVPRRMGDLLGGNQQQGGLPNFQDFFHLD